MKMAVHYIFATKEQFCKFITKEWDENVSLKIERRLIKYHVSTMEE
jgi:hypothetical protein